MNGEDPVPQQTSVTLNDGNTMPQFGLGVWQTPQDEAAAVVKAAIEAGYRMIDTAKIYDNEAGVGEGVRAAGIDPAGIYITTKLWNDEHGYDSTLRAFDDSAKRLGVETIDLYLIHWPAPRLDRYVDSWKALIRLKQEGRAKSIGVSNFEPENLERIIAETGVVPTVNQIELHPTFQQKTLREIHAKHDIKTESWSPLGRGKLFEDPIVAAIAAKHGKTAAQIVIRWHLDSGLIVIPKTVTPARLHENIGVFDFALDADDLAKLATLDRADGRIGPHPLTANF
jgi:2,5-diketo-D-gluconate reductase A